MSVPTANGQPFAGLTLKNIKESLIVCGHVNSAAHVTGVEGSVLVVASRQFRMHECRDCVVYLDCSSRPIIEDCKAIKFAPLPKAYVSSDCFLIHGWRKSRASLEKNEGKAVTNTHTLCDRRSKLPRPSNPINGTKSTTSNGSRRSTVRIGVSCHQRNRWLKRYGGTSCRADPDGRWMTY